MTEKLKKGLLLLSGGIDSPVAGYLAINQKVEVSALHFSTKKITGKESIEKAKKLCKKIGIKKLFLTDVSEEFSEISNKCDHKFYFVLTKRLMLKIAEKIAKQHKIDFLITGENIGQVSSQTLPNLAVIDKAVFIPVIRPLICFDKQEIISIARDIGTEEISRGKEMCDALGPPHPKTKTDLLTVLIEEKNCNSAELIKSALEKIRF